MSSAVFIELLISNNHVEVKLVNYSTHRNRLVTNKFKFYSLNKLNELLLVPIKMESVESRLISTQNTHTDRTDCMCATGLDSIMVGRV